MRAGCQLVVLSDKGPMEELSPPIPPLLATGAVHHHLIRAGECLLRSSFVVAFSHLGQWRAWALLLTDICVAASAAAHRILQCTLPHQLSPANARPLTNPPTNPLLPGLRTETSIAVETAQCFSTHHVAMLVGYGAHAVCPYLAFESCRQWRASPRTENLIRAGKVRAAP